MYKRQFFNSAVGVLQTLVVALGAGLGIWGVINLLEAVSYTHLDVYKRQVFDCENRYGELCPQQEKALEELGIPRPNPEKPKGRNNNRKQTFDAVCRTILFDIARRHGLHLDQEPSYGGDRKSTRLNSSHITRSRMPSSA